jgi:argininosuccinate synthase
MDRETMRIRDGLIPEYSRLIYNGFWYAPEREMLQAAISHSQQFVTGDVRLKLFKGGCHLVGRRSPYSLYDERTVTFEADQVYNQADAGGFIRLNALRLRLIANSKQRRY